MAEEIMSFAVQKLWDLLSKEYNRFQGVKGQVAELQNNLDMLKSFLKDTDTKKHTSARVRTCVKVIEEIIFDAEDIIGTFILKDEHGKNGGIKKRIRRLVCIIPERRETALEIGSLSKRISEVIDSMEHYGVRKLIDDVEDPKPSQQRREYGLKSESNLVGLEGKVKELVGYLVEEDDVPVVSITGMGGLGKTTLARQAFNHDKVQEKFDRRVWVCVSEVCNPINVWQTILRTLRPNEEETKISEMTDATVLQGELFRLFETSKSLVILDDIWKEEHWDQIKPIFPHKRGSKVLLTSRNERVAGRVETYINIKLEFLSLGDSWTLFQKIVMANKDASGLQNDAEMEEMGRQMIEYCGRLPLAIKVLGGLLAENYTVRYWKKVSKNMGSHLIERTNDNNNNNSFYNVLSLSYKELPSYLKYCFLYLAHFPEDYEISTENLSYYWAAEGILRYDDGETIQDIGDSYIEKLVRRNMVISEIDNTTSRFETCCLHDMMRKICLSKAKEDLSHGTSRRFVSHNLLDAEREINNSKARSLMVFRKDQWMWKLSIRCFTKLQLLRVLHLPSAEFSGERLPDSIEILIHLKYLNLADTNISHLPSSLRNLKLLIYLNLKVRGRSIHMYNVLMGKKGLRYLALPEDMHEKTKLELSHLVNLETLDNFSTEYCSLADLGGMARLKTLGVNLTGEISLENVSASIAGLRNVESLDIYIKNRAKGTKEWGTLFEVNNRKRLKLRIEIPLLSDELHFPCCLTSLSLWHSFLEEDPMPILEKLLHLKEVTFWHKTFCGTKMVCSSNGFSQLQKLKISGQSEWEEWIVEEGSMRSLETLEIYKCKKLKELPDGLQNITSLKDLRFGEESSKGGDVYHNFHDIMEDMFLEQTHNIRRI